MVGLRYNYAPLRLRYGYDTLALRLRFRLRLRFGYATVWLRLRIGFVYGTRKLQFR